MRILLALAAAIAALPAQAQELRDFCPDRPGLGTPACTLDPGHAMVEVGLAGWTLERQGAQRTDTLTLADTLVRLGLDPRTEVQLGWTAFGVQRERERLAGTVQRGGGVGDLTLAVRRNLRNPDGSGFSVAVMGAATLPTGGGAIGAGDWGASLLLPVSIDLGGDIDLELTPEVDAAVDEDRRGRHVAYGSVVGVEFPLVAALSAVGEVSVFRDGDPAGHVTRSQAGLALEWQRGDHLQFDAGAALGLNRTTDDLQLYVGIARRF